MAAQLFGSLLSSVVVPQQRSPVTALQQPDPLPVWRPSNAPDVDREQLELTYFSTSYLMPNTSLPCRTKRVACADLRFHMQGYMPATGGSYPVYLFVSGAGPWTNEIRNQQFDENLPEMVMLDAMARRGYVAAVAEFPDIHGSDLRCESQGPGMSLTEHSRAVFSWRGPGDNSSAGPLSVLCRRRGSDCSLGIALHGHSVGGLIANLAPRVAPVTAILLWGAGSRLPYAYSCCGLSAGNSSCCESFDGEPCVCRAFEPMCPKQIRAQRDRRSLRSPTRIA